MWEMKFQTVVLLCSVATSFRSNDLLRWLLIFSISGSVMERTLCIQLQLTFTCDAVFQILKMLHLWPPRHDYTRVGAECYLAYSQTLKDRFTQKTTKFSLNLLTPMLMSSNKHFWSFTVEQYSAK